MIYYNRNNNAYCRAVNAETLKTIEQNLLWISILSYTRNPYSYSYFEIVICIYSVRGDIDQMSTNTSNYTIGSAPYLYIFVYILIETHIAPLICQHLPERMYVLGILCRSYFCTKQSIVSYLTQTFLLTVVLHCHLVSRTANGECWKFGNLLTAK